jgi:hypothetical protein
MTTQLCYNIDPTVPAAQLVQLPKPGVHVQKSLLVAPGLAVVKPKPQGEQGALLPPSEKVFSGHCSQLGPPYLLDKNRPERRHK